MGKDTMFYFYIVCMALLLMGIPLCLGQLVIVLDEFMSRPYAVGIAFPCCTIGGMLVAGWYVGYVARKV